MKLLFLLIILHCLQYIAGAASSYCEKTYMLRAKSVGPPSTDPSLTATTERSAIECGRKCQQQEKCTAFTWSKATSLCLTYESISSTSLQSGRDLYLMNTQVRILIVMTALSFKRLVKVLHSYNTITACSACQGPAASISVPK